MTWDQIHKVVTEITGVFTSGVLLIIHGEGAVERLKGWTGLREIIDRSGGDRRHIVELSKLITEGPSFVEAIIQLEKDLQADWSVIAPQNPKLIQDIATIKQKALDIFGAPAVGTIPVTGTTPS